MSTTFTKLFSGLTESTVWVEAYPTRVLWVSMLSWADQHGRVFGSVPGIARRAGITLDECEAALVSFMSPDRHSRTPDHDGRRVEKIDGGWRLLNYSKYREMRDTEARREYQREWDRQHRPSGWARQSDKQSDSPTKVQSNPTQAEAEEEIKPKHTVEQTPLDGVCVVHDFPKSEKRERVEAAKRVLSFLNEKSGKAFRPVPANLDLIVARLKDGATEADLRKVIARQCREWVGTDMEKYCRPSTLFNRLKFEQYIGACVIPQEVKNA